MFIRAGALPAIRLAATILPASLKYTNDVIFVIVIRYKFDSCRIFSGLRYIATLRPVRDNYQ